MTEIAITLGSVLFLVAVLVAVRAQHHRQALTAPNFATTPCEQCNAAIGPGDGVRAQGSMYCSEDCARWAW